MTWLGTKVLVTGGSGFIGSHLCRRLTTIGAEVWAVSLAANTQKADSHFHQRQADVSQPGVVGQLIRDIQPDVIFHLASYVTGSRDIAAVIPTFDANLKSTVYLLTAATQQQCKKVVIAGSMEEPLPHSSDSIPSSPYAASKWAASTYASLFFNVYKTPVVNARLFMVYGPGQQDLQKIIPYTILSLLKKESPQFSSGKRKIDWIYVDDVVEGLLACAVSARAAGKTVDIGSGILTPTREIIEAISRLMDPSVPLGFGSMPDRPLEHERVADLKKTQAIIDWQPKTLLNTGLAKTIERYEQLSKIYSSKHV